MSWWLLVPQDEAFPHRRPRTWRLARHLGLAFAAAGRPAGRFLLAGLVCFMASEIRAESLRQGDVAIGAYQSFARYNRYWYHYNGETDCNGLPCSRANLNSYDSIDVPVIGTQSAAMETTTLAITGFRVEYGLLERLLVAASTQLAYVSSPSSTWNLGDTWLRSTWQATPDAPLTLGLGTALKLPGTYSPNAIVAAGGGQPDLEFGARLWGHAFRRKFVYNVTSGYRFRFPFADTVFVTLSDNEGVVRRTPVVGPSDEVFLDFVAGLFVSRKTYLFLNGSVNNAFGGTNIDDYFATVSSMQEKDSSGAPVYQVDGDPADLLSTMEEDFFLLGAGVLFRLRYSATLYVNYTLKVLGQNTPAFYVPDGTRFPLGKVLVGFEYTFGARGPKAVNARRETHAEAPRLADLRRFPSMSSGTRD